MKLYLVKALIGVGFMLSIGLGAMGCAPQTPEEKIASIRARYTAKINGFIVQEEPVELEVEPMLNPEGLEALEVEDTSESLEASEVNDIPSFAVSTKVLLDILIQHDSSEKLNGVTVDISMVDSEQREKGHWRVWFDTSTIEKANIVSKTHILEDPGYEEGDGFHAEVRRIPDSERSEYQDFSSTE